MKGDFPIGSKMSQYSYFSVKTTKGILK